MSQISVLRYVTRHPVLAVFQVGFQACGVDVLQQPFVGLIECIRQVIKNALDAWWETVLQSL